jgi:quercetin dioxygenase-like cupin family protein
MEGTGRLLLAENEVRAFSAGEVARFSEGEIHGFENDGSSPFVYISVTSPPINFDYAYGR